MADDAAARDEERAGRMAVPAWLLHASGVALAGLAGYAAFQGAAANQPLVPPERRDLAVLAILAVGLPVLIGRTGFVASRTGKLVGAAGIAFAFSLAAQAYPPLERVPEFIMLCGIPWAALVALALGIGWLVMGLLRRAPALDQTGTEWPLVTAAVGLLVLLPVMYFSVGQRYELEGHYLMSCGIKLVQFTLVFLIATAAVGRPKVGPAVHIYAVVTIVVALVGSVVAGTGGEEMAGGWWGLP